jgi:hypothetical protein
MDLVTRNALLCTSEGKVQEEEAVTKLRFPNFEALG